MEDRPYFEAYDQYGRWVYCDWNTWTNKFWWAHGNAADDLALAKRAITQPEDGYPRYDKDRPKDRRVYYRKSPTEDYYMKVVVQFREIDGRHVGRVVTGYNPDDIDEKEDLETSP